MIRLKLLKNDNSIRRLVKLFRHVGYDETTKVVTFTKHDGTTQTLTIT